MHTHHCAGVFGESRATGTKCPVYWKDLLTSQIRDDILQPTTNKRFASTLHPFN